MRHRYVNRPPPDFHDATREYTQKAVVQGTIILVAHVTLLTATVFRGHANDGQKD